MGKRTRPLEILNSPEVDNLAISVEEAARAANVKNPRFVEPARGTLDRAKARRHHIIFGRRGAGKSSLLAKAAADLTIQRRPIAFVDLEGFKGHSYPDVLLSVLIKSLKEFTDWFKTAATIRSSRTTFWKKFFGTTPQRPPLEKTQVAQLVAEIEGAVADLTRQLYSPESSSTTETIERAKKIGGTNQAQLGLKAGGASIDVGSSGRTSDSYRSQTTEESTTSKVDFLHRSIIKYQTLFQTISHISDGDAYLFLDDLYHIRRSDQPRVIDYFHRITKGSQVWLKIGTIRHRTDWYRHSDPPVGLKLGDDAEEINLDLTLEKYSLTKDFLMSVLRGIAFEVNFESIKEILGEGAINRLVLASGGVARDFLAIFRRAIDIARERGGGSRGSRISVEDVNKAAGEYEASKRDELQRDTPEEREQVEVAFGEVRKFCLEQTKANCFLMEQDRVDAGAKLIQELVDLRLLHLVQSRVTIPDRPGKLYVGFMLDLGQYTGERARRGFELIPFWQRTGTDRLRRASLIYDPWIPK